MPDPEGHPQTDAGELAGGGHDPRQFEAMVTAVRDYGIFMLDPSGTVATWNAGAGNIKGYAAEEIVGRHFSAFYPAEDREAGVPAAALETARREGRFEGEGWRLRKDGTRFWANVIITAIRDEAGELIGFTKVTRDLTERRRTEQELQAFASTAAHDLQEPLRTVAGFTDLRVRRHADELGDEAREFLRHIESAVDRMSRLLADLLAFTRSANPVEPGPVPLAEVVEQVHGGLRASIEQRGARVELDVPTHAVVLGDRTGVQLVVQNLLSNALRFAASEDPLVRLAADESGGCWRVTVDDNGPGVPEAKRAEIFDPFVQLQRHEEGGAGLGLSICRRVADRLGGSVGVEDAPGGGARFWFRLPAVPGAPGPSFAA